MIFHKQTSGVRCGVLGEEILRAQGISLTHISPIQAERALILRLLYYNVWNKLPATISSPSRLRIPSWRCPRRTGDPASTLRQRRLNNLLPGGSELQGSYTLTPVPTATRNCRPPQHGERFSNLNRSNLHPNHTPHVTPPQIPHHPFLATIQHA